MGPRRRRQQFQAELLGVQAAGSVTDEDQVGEREVHAGQGGRLPPPPGQEVIDQLHGAFRVGQRLGHLQGPVCGDGACGEGVAHAPQQPGTVDDLGGRNLHRERRVHESRVDLADGDPEGEEDLVDGHPRVEAFRGGLLGTVKFGRLRYAILVQSGECDLEVPLGGAAKRGGFDVGIGTQRREDLGAGAIAQFGHVGAQRLQDRFKCCGFGGIGHVGSSVRRRTKVSRTVAAFLIEWRTPSPRRGVLSGPFVHTPDRLAGRERPASPRRAHPAPSRRRDH